ncbi:hypothetical protein ABFV83_09975 [Lacrimispora sp. BS-2]|uniref:Uncharacterized protein n=1 Tax=Lacrimispora sp. BS-2 TaxID=3151850 RepID=A0AAU7PUX0_9FIRM
MKRILKYIGLFILAIIVLFMVLAVLIVFLALKSKSERSTAHNSQHIIFEFGAREMPTFEEPQLVYAVTKEEALVAVNQKIYFAEDYLYASKVSDIMKIFENDEYATMVYFSKMDPKEGALVFAKFKIRTVENKKQYALLTAIIQGHGDPGKTKITPEREFSLFCQAIQVSDISNLRDLSIVEGNRFVFGGLDGEYVKRLKIEGQSPTEIIEYTLYGEKRYFWYYENLISDKPSSEFDIEIEE